MNYLEFILFDLLYLKDLSDIALICIDEFSMFLRILLGFVIQESFIVLFIDK